MRTGFAVALALAMSMPLSAQTSGAQTTGTPGKEPKEITEIGGRTLEQWAKDITHKDPSKRELAIRMVMSFGPERAYAAVPAMLTELRRHTADYPIDTSIRVNLAMALGTVVSAKLGTKNEPEPKVLKETVTLLIRLVKDSQGIVKFRAAQALASFGDDARAATPDLMTLLKDTRSYEVRQAGALALGRVARDPGAGVPTYVTAGLQGLLKDDAFQVRQAACQSLVMLGAPGDPGLKQQMLGALSPVAKKDPEPAVQIWANMAIMVYAGALDKTNLEQITQMLHKGEAGARVQAAQALSAVGPLAKETIPALIGALGDAEVEVRGWAVLALGRMESTRANAALEVFAADPKQPDPLKKMAKETLDQAKKKMAGAK